MIKKTLKNTILFCSIIAAVNTYAADDKKEAIDSLLATMNASRMADSMAQGLREDVRGATGQALEEALVADKKLSNEQKKALVPKLQKSVTSLREKAGSIFTKPEFKQSFIAEQAAQYAKSYSVEDIKVLNTFFQTETGKKFLVEQGKIAQGTIANLQQKYMPQAIEDLKKLAAQEINTASK